MDNVTQTTIKFLKKLKRASPNSRRYSTHWEIINSILHGTRLRTRRVPASKTPGATLIIKWHIEVDMEIYQTAYDELEKHGIIYKEGHKYLISNEYRQYLIDKKSPTEDEVTNKDTKRIDKDEFKRQVKVVGDIIYKQYSSNAIEKLENSCRSGKFEKLFNEQVSAFVFWRTMKTTKSRAWARYKQKWIEYYHGSPQALSDNQRSNLKRTFERRLSEYDKMLVELIGNHPQLGEKLAFLHTGTNN